MSSPPGAGQLETSFAVELPLFNGPFRLLAELLLEQKMDVCDVPLARVTDSFLERGLRSAGRWTIEEASWFVAVCAVLLELKVGRLLPRPAAGLEEDLLGGASPDLIYARGLELEAFRRVAERIQGMIAAAAMMAPRSAAPAPEFAHLYPDVMERVSAEGLRREAVALLAEPVVELGHIAPIRASLTEAMEQVTRHLSVVPQALFRDLLSDCSQRIEVVVRFLALLELYREGKVELRQSKVFGDIAVRWEGPLRNGAPPEREG